MKINPKKVKIYLKLIRLVSILIYRSKNNFRKSEDLSKVKSTCVDTYNTGRNKSEIKTRNKIQVLGKSVDTYSIDPDISEDFTKVYSGSVDTYSRERNLKVFHSPCEIAYLYCSMAYALSHRELIEIP